LLEELWILSDNISVFKLCQGEIVLNPV
jgi:hypothetical protein